MDISVLGRHTKISDEFRERVVDKLHKIESLDARVHRVDIHVVHERNPKLAHERERLEITVYGQGSVVRTVAAAEDRVAALDLAVDRLVERLRKQHERRAHRHQGRVSMGTFAATPPEGTPAVPSPQAEATSVEVWEDAPDDATREIPLAGTPITIRSKTHMGQPMTTSDAIDEMELVGHDFYLFHDAESGLPSAVYRRRGWTYGVIHLERDPSGVLRDTA